MKKKFKNFYFLPFVFILAFPLLLNGIFDGRNRFYFAFLVSLCLPIFIRIVCNIKPFIFVLLSFPVLLIAINYSVMIMEYDSFVNIGSWNSIINSNKNEVSEFSSELQTITKSLIIIQIITYISYLFFTWKKSIPKTKTKYRLVLLGILCLLIVDFNVRGATKFSFPLRAINSLYDYYKVKKQEAKYFEIKKNAVFNAKRTNEFDKNTEETIVIVVGETLRRDHLEYYGCKKPTTPLMKKENLIVYNDVISPANQTVNSLQRVFTLVDGTDENDYWKTPSLIMSFKEIGFETFWLSTQQVYDKYINEVSFIAQESDSIIYRQPINYDATILTDYKNILKSTAKKKLIIVHLLGNHARYNKRYPKSFATFSKHKSDDKRVNSMREYDDAVRYNDYILFELLSALKQQKGESSFTMFSDHGESLYDSNSKHCFHGSVKPAQSEFEVPFVMWFSKEFQNKHDNLMQQVHSNKDKSIILSDFFHTLPAFYGIKFSKLKPENNFLGRNYSSKENRKIVNGNLDLLEYKKLKNKHANINY
jgi:heptose-I-phosphate ethanolaminephosphotransferase